MDDLNQVAPEGQEVATEAEWFAGLQVSDESKAVLSSFKSVDEVAQSFINLQNEFKIPDAYNFEDPDLQDNDKEVLVAISKEAGLSQAQASKVAQAAKLTAAGLREKQIAEANRLYESTLSEVQAKYGARTPDLLQKANDVVTKFGGKEFRDYLNSTGLDNHPAVVKMFINIAEALQEDPNAGLGLGSRGAHAPEIKDPSIELRAALADPSFRDAIRRGDQVALDKMAGLKRLAEAASSSKR